MYAGNFGRMCDFQPLLQASSALQAHEEIFVLVGSGHKEKALRRLVETMGLNDVRFCAPVPEDRLSELLYAVNLHVVSLKHDADRVMWPRKIDTLVARRLKTVAVGFDPGIAGVDTV